jgi:hypothetical protein
MESGMRPPEYPYTIRSRGRRSDLGSVSVGDWITIDGVERKLTRIDLRGWHVWWVFDDGFEIESWRAREMGATK